MKLLLILFLGIAANSLDTQNTNELDIIVENLSKKWEIIDVIHLEMGAE
tara:strand:- start:1441 stop:1587 length:147 start_codon:yes stop_codon:yes gene_type:complete